MRKHRSFRSALLGWRSKSIAKPGLDCSNRVTPLVWDYEFERAGVPLSRKVGIAVLCKGTRIPLGFDADLLVAGTVILERRAVPALLPAHEAQLLAYVRIAGPPVGVADNRPRDAQIALPGSTKDSCRRTGYRRRIVDPA